MKIYFTFLTILFFGTVNSFSQSDWHTIAGNDFSLDFPVEPALRDGGLYAHLNFSEFGLETYEFTQEEIDKAGGITNLILKATAKNSAALISSNRVRRNGKEGIEMVMMVEQIYIYKRIVKKNNTLYIQSAIFYQGFVNHDRIDRFYNSFRFIRKNFFSLRVGAGYGFPLGSQTLGSVTNNVSTDPADSYRVYGSYGEGTYMSITPGVLLSGRVQLDMEVSYLRGKNFHTGNESLTMFVSVDTEGQMLQFKPAITTYMPNSWSHFYIRMGGIVGFGKLDKYQISENLTQNTETFVYLKYSDGMALGITSAIGFDFRMGDHVGFYTELNANMLNWMPRKMEFITYTFNGQDYLENMTEEERVRYFVKNKDHSTTDPDQPKAEYGTFLPFSTMGLNVGLQFFF